MKENRKLAAILAADVVGYSRLMQEDEAGTLRSFRVLRATVLEPAITGAGGRIFKWRRYRVLRRHHQSRPGCPPSYAGRRSDRAA